MRPVDEHVKAFRDVAGRYRKLADQPIPSVELTICAWTDLLGFGTPLAASSWTPDDALWSQVASRVLMAQSACWERIVPNAEYVLMLNDGLARTCTQAIHTHPDLLSYWLRECIQTHCAIYRQETLAGLPGGRTVIACGPRLRYSHESLTYDDFVFTYTKPDPRLPGTLAKIGHDPVIASNPGALQMNLAFSKAYILDQGGKAWGLPGPHIYLDESVFALVRHISSTTGIGEGYVDCIQGPVYRFALLNRVDGTRFHLGFDCDPDPIEIDKPEIVTRVWRLRAFYPCDEDVADFRIEVC